MLDTLIKYDQELLIFLNNLGSSFWDPFWLFITNQFSWSPVFLLIIILAFWKYGWKKGLLFVISIIVLVAFSDQFVNLIKDSVGRLRPNNDPDVMNQIRALLQPQSKSFVSGHATTSLFFSVFAILFLRNKVRYVSLILLFPLLFGYSRIYVGVHYPLDILTGYLLGATMAFLYFKLVDWIDKKIFA